MKKPILITLIIFIVLIFCSISFWSLYKTLTVPNQLKLIIPDESETSLDSIHYVEIKIDDLKRFYLNDSIICFEQIPEALDSLGSIGHNDSVIVLSVAENIKMSIIVEVMNFAKATNRKLILSTKNE